MGGGLLIFTSFFNEPLVYFNLYSNEHFRKWKNKYNIFSTYLWK